MVAEFDFKTTFETALEKCSNGKFSTELKLLYNSPWREQVNWERFPNWARPHDPVEGAHEG